MMESVLNASNKNMSQENKNVNEETIEKIDKELKRTQEKKQNEKDLEQGFDNNAVLSLENEKEINQTNKPRIAKLKFDSSPSHYFESSENGNRTSENVNRAVLFAESEKNFGKFVIQSEKSRKSHKSHKSHKSYLNNILHLKKRRKNIFTDSSQCKEELWKVAFSEKNENAENIFKKIIDNTYFKMMSFFTVLYSSCWIAVDLDFERTFLFDIVDNIICVLFVLEALATFLSFENMKIALKNVSFLFDVILTLLTIFETWMIKFILNDDSNNLKSFSVLRSVRLFRIMRLGKVINKVPEIMVVVRGVFLACRGVLAVMILEVVVMYSAAIVLRVICEGKPIGKMWFSTVTHSMGTLLVQCTLSGSKCGFLMVEAWETDVTIAICIFIFVLIGHITIMGILTGLMVQTIRTTSVLEKEKGIIAEIDKQTNASWENCLETEIGDGMNSLDADLFSIETMLLDEDFADFLNVINVDRAALFYELSLKSSQNVDCRINRNDLKKIILNIRGNEPALVKHHVETRTFMYNLFTELH